NKVVEHEHALHAVDGKEPLGQGRTFRLLRVHVRLARSVGDGAIQRKLHAVGIRGRLSHDVNGSRHGQRLLSWGCSPPSSSLLASRRGEVSLRVCSRTRERNRRTGQWGVHSAAWGLTLAPTASSAATATLPSISPW